ncbi:MAG: hypothetical protein QNK37_25820 [Acidobacteriota bacterium]|nr:hypothetical protein [Acidobacteriota bacterium]
MTGHRFYFIFKIEYMTVSDLIIFFEIEYMTVDVPTFLFKIKYMTGHVLGLLFKESNHACHEPGIQARKVMARHGNCFKRVPGKIALRRNTFRRLSGRDCCRVQGKIGSRRTTSRSAAKHAGTRLASLGTRNNTSRQSEAMSR